MKFKDEYEQIEIVFTRNSVLYDKRQPELIYLTEVASRCNELGLRGCRFVGMEQTNHRVPISDSVYETIKYTAFFEPSLELNYE